MSFCNTVSYHGDDWQYACLDFDSKLDEDIVRNVIWNIVDIVLVQRIVLVVLVYIKKNIVFLINNTQKKNMKF